MKILIYGINYSPEVTGIGKFTGEMAEWMAASDHAVRVVTAPPYYPEWRVSSDYMNRYSRGSFKGVEVFRCPLFVPSDPSSISRILHLLSFSVSSFVPLLRNIPWKPDVVILVVPTILCFMQTLLLCKITGAKSIVHIQDYEIDAMFGLSMAKNGFLRKVALWVERMALNRFNKISTISDGMQLMARDKGLIEKKLMLFPNWSDIEMFSDAPPGTNILAELGIPKRKKIILYSGNIGDKQGLEYVLYVAKELEYREDLHFLVVGEGAAKRRLKEIAKNMDLRSVSFMPLVKAEKLPSLLALASCHLIIQRAGAADTVLPSKLSNILASGGNAVITASDNTSLGRLCNEHKGIATLVSPESSTALKEGILKTLDMTYPNFIAIEYANKNLNKEVILKRFMEEIH